MLRCRRPDTQDGWSPVSTLQLGDAAPLTTHPAHTSHSPFPVRATGEDGWAGRDWAILNVLSTSDPPPGVRKRPAGDNHPWRFL